MFQLCDLQDEGVQSTVLALPRKLAPTPDGGWFRQGDLDDLRDRIKVQTGAGRCPVCRGFFVSRGVAPTDLYLHGKLHSGT